MVLLSNKSVFSGALKIVEHTEENIILSYLKNKLCLKK